MKRGKRYTEAAKDIEPGKEYSVNDAVSIIKKGAVAKFDETVEVAMRLGVDPRHADQMVRGSVALPHGTGKQVRVLVLTRGEHQNEAKEAGAEYVGADDYIEQIQQGWVDFDVMIATPDIMKDVGKLGRVLGPRGLMPNPKSGTVTDDVPGGIQAVKAGRVEYKLDKGSNVAIVIGKRSFTREQLIENARAAMDSLGQARPEDFKGNYVKNITLSSTMSPGVRLTTAEYGRY